MNTSYIYELLGIKLPQSEQTEEAVLGALLKNNKLFYEVDGIVNEDCFLEDRRKRIFVAIKELIKSGESADVFSVIGKLVYTTKETKKYLLSLPNEMETTAGLLTHARIIKEKALRRKLMENAIEMIKDAGQENDIEQIISKSNKNISEISTASSDDIVTMKKALHDIIDLVNVNKTSDVIIGYPTGFKFYDKRSGGFHDSDLVVIAAESSQGKSALATFLLLNIAKKGFNCAFFTLEMSINQLMGRILSMNSRIPASEILYKKLEDYQYTPLMDGVAKVEKLPIFFDGGSFSDIDSIISKIRLLVAKHGVKVVVFDYFQQSYAKGNFGTKEQEMGYMARSLKALAKELNICIIALSQLNRSNATNKPTKASLKDSSQIEHVADVIMLLYRPEEYGKRFDGNFEHKQPNGYAQIDVAKGRNTGRCEFLCGFNSELTMFYDVHIDEIPNISLPEKPQQKRKEIDKIIDYSESNNHGLIY